MDASTPVNGHASAITRPGRWLLWVLLAIIVGAFVVRLAGIVEPMGPDQGVYATIGWGLQRGLALYRDLWELKPPGIYVTYLLGFALFGSREASIFWIDYLAAAVTTWLIFDLGRRTVGLRFGALAAAVFAVGTIPAARFSLGGFLERAISEKFISLLAAASAWMTVVAATRTRARWAVAAGVCVGLASVYKPFALAYWPAWVLWTWFVTDMARARRFAVYSAMGILAAPFAAFVWLAAGGVLHDAWVALVEFNTAYLAVGGYGPVYIADRFAHEVYLRMRDDEVWGLGCLSAVVACCAWRWRATAAGRAAALGIVWLGAALVAIPANGPRMFRTYFVPPLVPLCLLAAWLLHQTLVARHRWRMAAGLAVVGVTAAMIVHSGSVPRAVSATAWDARHLFGRTDRLEYLQRFGARNQRAFSAAANERLARYVAAHTDERDRVFVFGMTGGTYFSSRRLPASRFLFVYPAVSRLIDRPEFRVDTLAAELALASPRYIVLQRYNADSFSGWRVEDSFGSPPMVALLRRYRQETEIGNFVLYRRIDDRP